MSNNPFKAVPPATKVKRNTFDLSFVNNLTLKFGDLVPIMCKEVIPGDSFEIDPQIGFRFMPTQFPVQTRMRADVHFFYVRNRNLWKNWKKFISDTPSVNVTTGVEDTIVFPYIGDKRNTDFYSEGSLADYLGIPTNVISNGDSYIQSYPDTHYLPLEGQIGVSDWQNFMNMYAYSGDTLKIGRSIIWDPFNDGHFTVICKDKLGGLPHGPLTLNDNSGTFQNIAIERVSIVYKLVQGDVSYPANSKYVVRAVAENREPQETERVLLYQKSTETGEETGLRFWSKKGVTNLRELYEIENIENCYFMIDFRADCETLSSLNKYGVNPELSFGASFSITYNTTSGSVEYNEAAKVYNPTNEKGLKISALPFRAYESIFNGFYRNERVDPLIKNGKYVYDEFVTTDEDGVDNTQYKLFRRYWEKDFLTTALPSPQQGNAPLVGATTNKEITNTTTQRVVIDGVDSEINLQTKPNGEVVGMSYYGATLPVGSVEALQSAIDFGISINDLRNVNALQKWLEVNVRRGYLYKDQLYSHFGVNVSFEELQMPEFIGGMTERIETGVIYNQSGTAETGLGEYAGSASVFGKGKHKIRKYCDEHGFIIGIVSIVPIPSYSQIMPKHFLKSQHLDFFFPEFGHIGYQPITLEEVTPLQAFDEGGSEDNLRKVFGYQRAYYDYLASVDEVHGNFRSSMRNYLVNREFADVPQLSRQFLEINNNEVNDIFAVQKPTDKIIGQIYLGIKAKRPIPYFGTPALT